MRRAIPAMWRLRFARRRRTFCASAHAVQARSETHERKRCAIAATTRRTTRSPTAAAFLLSPKTTRSRARTFQARSAGREKGDLIMHAKSSSNLARLAALPALATLLVAAACSKTNESAPSPATQPPAQSTTTMAATNAPPTPTTTAAPVVAGPPGTIEGVVKFTGTAPAAKPIDKVSDPVCAAAKPMDNAIVSKNGGLGGVLVRIEVGGAHGDATGNLPQLKQEGCMYTPRVLGAIAGQDVEIVNADKTMHNVHTYKGQETVLNAGQPAGAQPLKRPASDEAGTLKVKCDVHPWMTAYIVVTDHPFFTVTDDAGAFKIPNVPPGKYKVEAWHPEFGAMTKEIEVVASKPVDPGFSYTGTEKKPE
jgi:plastocyanin